MKKNLIIIIGSSGNIATMLVNALIRSNDFDVVTCGRRPQSKGVPTFKWQFGDPIPVEEILKEYPYAKSIQLVYAAIKWPVNLEEYKQNIESLSTIMECLPSSCNFIYISSFIAKTSSQSWYARLKKDEEKLVQEKTGKILRVGVVDSTTPFGQVAFFLSLAQRLSILPVPYPKAMLTISSEEDIISSLKSMLSNEKGGYKIIEVNSHRMEFIKLLRSVLTKNKLKTICLPMPSIICSLVFFITNFIW